MRVYFGIELDGRLVAAAGTHTHSRRHRVGTIGGVFTLPEFRGRGFATALTAAVTVALFNSEVDTVALNVREDNSSAKRAYQRLGFTTHAVYWEGHATLHGSRG